MNPTKRDSDTYRRGASGRCGVPGNCGPGNRGGSDRRLLMDWWPPSKYFVKSIETSKITKNDQTNMFSNRGMGRKKYLYNTLLLSFCNKDWLLSLPCGIIKPPQTSAQHSSGSRGQQRALEGWLKSAASACPLPGCRVFGKKQRILILFAIF